MKKRYVLWLFLALSVFLTDNTQGQIVSKSEQNPDSLERNLSSDSLQKEILSSTPSLLEDDFATDPRTELSPLDCLSFHTSALWGKNIFGENLFATTYGFDYGRKLNNKLSLRVGMEIVNTDAKSKCKDLAPRRKRTAAQGYIGLSYVPNEKIILEGDLFYSSIDNSIGADLDFTYKFSDNCFVNIYALFSKSMEQRLHPVPGI